ncbi:MAG TPA: preprotein translocase subunit SecY [Candidatus Polarisedimenticolia bacterium]|jgi:preprotein translocase subunit SecY|nr:preprotein translocase subunit SecY [Candidatus Polarisedimenticolia bacterium]
MFEKLANIFRVPDLRKRVLFTLAMLAVYRLGSHIPTPGINTDQLQKAFEQQSGGLLGFYDLFSGGNLRRLTIFALGIMPYITASIILQLLTVVWEPLARLQKEGDLGRRKITQWTRYLTLILSILQSMGIAFTLQAQKFVVNPGPSFILMTIVTLTTGSIFIMWLGEQITERGVGNGMSLLIFSGIVVGLPKAVVDLSQKARSSAWGSFTVPALLILVAIMILVVAFIVFMERSERRIPVQYAKRVVGRRIMGGQATHLPLRVNSGGVMPVIFASSLLSIPQMLTLSNAFKPGGTLNRYFGGTMEQLKWGEPLYTLLYAVGIIFFAYFYVSIVFNPSDVADNMRKYGGFIPGIRPGHRTRDYINDVLTRVTLVGGLYLILISLIPEWMIAGIHLDHIPWIGPRVFSGLPTWVLHGLNVNFYFGGTSLLIVVGVAMDTVNQIESQLVMRHYEGFTSRSGRVRGRRLWG